MVEEKEINIGKGWLLATSFCFGIAVLMLLALAVHAWTASNKLLDARQRIFFFEGVNRDLRDLQRLVLDIETGQRGFLITGAQEDLAPFADASKARLDATDALRDKVSDEPELSASIPRLEGLIEMREEELKEAIRIRREADFDAASEAVRSDLSNRLSDQIRGEIDSMIGIASASAESSEVVYRKRVDALLFTMKLATAVTLISGMSGLVLLLVQVRAQGRVIALAEAKEQAERADREKTKFLASMNHEIRTPLNAMLGFSELLEGEIETDRGRRFIAAIRSSGESLAELINDILDLSKIESGALDLDPEPTPVKEFATGIAVMFEEQAAAKGLAFRCEIDADCPDGVVVDGLRFRQVLVNLVGNALKFTESGEIRMGFHAEDIEESAAEDGTRLCTLVAEVEDTGRGIPKEKQSLVFEPFKQGARQDEELGGTGLGLSICRELVILMGGTIELKSEPGVGSLFRVLLPGLEIADGVNPKVTVAAKANDFDDLPPSRILVVDDNPYNRDLVGGFLEGTRHKVFFGENGLQALQLMRTVSPDVVLMDIRMPVMTGDEAREKMLEDDSLSSIPVIAVTASSLMRQERRLRRLFDGYLRKPFSGERLLESLRRALGRAQDGDSSADELGRDELLEDPPTQAFRREIEDPDGLLQELESLSRERWSELSGSMVFSEIFAVADELVSLGERHGAGDIVDYGRVMRSHAENFEQEQLERHLGWFEELVDRYRTE